MGTLIGDRFDCTVLKYLLFSAFGFFQGFCKESDLLSLFHAASQPIAPLH